MNIAWWHSFRHPQALEFAALLLMEKLTPSERAAYVLREAFDYPYAQIAEIPQSTEPAVRQMVSRARKHMTSGTTRTCSHRSRSS